MTRRYRVVRHAVQMHGGNFEVQYYINGHWLAYSSYWSKTLLDAKDLINKAKASESVVVYEEGGD